MMRRIKKRDWAGAIKDNGYILFLLLVFVILAIVKYGRAAPALLLAVFFKFTLFLVTLMFMPFITGLAGFTKSVRKAWLVALVLPLVLAVLFQILYHENILRLWYQGAFDRKYLSGLLEAAVVVPGICFLAGFIVRVFRASGPS